MENVLQIHSLGADIVNTATFIRLLKADDKSATLGRAVDALRSGAADPTIHEVEQKSLTLLPGSPFAYWVSDNIRESFHRWPAIKDCPSVLGIQHGLSSKDDFRWLRLTWEVTRASQPRWAPFAKGGEYGPYYADIHLLVDQADAFAALKLDLLQKYPYLLPLSGTRRKHVDQCTPQELNSAASWVIHPENRYLQPGLTWPRRTTSGLSVRVMPEGCIFADKGPALFAAHEAQLWFLLGLMTSQPFEALVGLALGAADLAARSYEVGLIQRVPAPPAGPQDQDLLSRLAREAHEGKRALDRVTEPSHVFTLPALLSQGGSLLSERLAKWNEHVHSWRCRIETADRGVDQICYQLYEVSGNDRQTIETELGAGVKGLPEPLPIEKATAALVSWAFGVAMGRLDVRLATGERPIPDLPDPFAVLPAFSPGMLPNGRVPAGYPVRVTEDGILVDDEGHDWDIVVRVGDVFHLAFGNLADAIEREACEILAVGSLRDYFTRLGAKGFWDDHVKHYSKSRRRAPIYWLFRSPRGLYSAWVYYHHLDGDTLHRLLGPKYLGSKIQRIRQAIDDLRPAGRPKAGITKKEEQRLAEHTDLLVDLEEFAAKIEVVIRRVNERGETVGYDPDFDDGVVLNAAPLHELIPWSRKKKHRSRSVSELVAYWDELAEGKYDWAHIAMRYWPIRVTERCRADRSLALAHRLDGDFFPGLRDELRRQAETKTNAPPGDGGPIDDETEEEDE